MYIGIGCIWAAGSSANRANLGTGWAQRRHSSYLGFGTVSSLKSGIQKSVCPTLPKILQILWTAILLFGDLFHPSFIRVNIVRWEGARISDRTKLFTKSCTVHLNVKSPSQSLVYILFWHRPGFRPRYTNSIALAWEQWVADVMQVNTNIFLFLNASQPLCLEAIFSKKVVTVHKCSLEPPFLMFCWLGSLWPMVMSCENVW